VITVTACRECHREDRHQLSCSHVRYEARTVIQPSDEVAADHEPTQPYCPGPTVVCYYGDGDDAALCAKTGGTCYYGTSEAGA